MSADTVSEPDARAGLTTSVAQALRAHRVEIVMLAPDTFSWECLTCGAAGQTQRCFEVAEQDSLTHHTDLVVDAALRALAEQLDSALVAARAERDVSRGAWSIRLAGRVDGLERARQLVRSAKGTS